MCYIDVTELSVMYQASEKTVENGVEKYGRVRNHVI